MSCPKLVAVDGIMVWFNTGCST